MPEPGLCGTCRHARTVETPASRFWRCGLHAAQPDRYRKYPPLPVLRCAGWEPERQP